MRGSTLAGFSAEIGVYLFKGRHAFLWPYMTLPVSSCSNRKKTHVKWQFRCINHCFCCEKHGQFGEPVSFVRMLLLHKLCQLHDYHLGSYYWLGFLSYLMFVLASSYRSLSQSGGSADLQCHPYSYA